MESEFHFEYYYWLHLPCSRPPRFNVEQSVEISELSYVQRNLDRLLQENDHFSLYLFPFTTKCQINTWNGTNRGPSFLGTVREFLSISMDIGMVF